MKLDTTKVVVERMINGLRETQTYSTLTDDPITIDIEDNHLVLSGGDFGTFAIFTPTQWFAAYHPEVDEEPA